MHERPSAPRHIGDPVDPRWKAYMDRRQLWDKQTFPSQSIAYDENTGLALSAAIRNISHTVYNNSNVGVNLQSKSVIEESMDEPEYFPEELPPEPAENFKHSAAVTSTVTPRMPRHVQNRKHR